MSAQTVSLRFLARASWKARRMVWAAMPRMRRLPGLSRHSRRVCPVDEPQLESAPVGRIFSPPGS